MLLLSLKGWKADETYGRKHSKQILQTYKFNAQAIKDTFPTADTQQDTTPSTERPLHCNILSYMKLLIYGMQVNEIFLKD